MFESFFSCAGEKINEEKATFIIFHPFFHTKKFDFFVTFFLHFLLIPLNISINNHIQFNKVFSPYQYEELVPWDQLKDGKCNFKITDLGKDPIFLFFCLFSLYPNRKKNLFCSFRFLLSSLIV